MIKVYVLFNLDYRDEFWCRAHRYQIILIYYMKLLV